MLEFRWVPLSPEAWVLSPSPITVRAVEGFWAIHVGDRPMASRYTSAQGAKLDAWQYATAERQFLFGTYGQIRLVEDAHGIR